MANKIKVTLVKSVIGRPEQQRKVVETLGLKKTNSFVIHEDTPAIRGMVNKVSHLVQIEEVDA
ncbi:MAG: 50S ribosomal protein L30 [Peptococcales bacterium]|jgi:large subunit ribosomal protein L30